ncbi:MaoC family dehydratase [Photobacterium satsumensis]|uniref:MaoC family dehydratase n=1 Tax=Photobacterium satsumensis TaxID=2910239 RepID=UPI003D0A5C33
MTIIRIKQHQLPAPISLLAKALLKKGKVPLPQLSVVIGDFVFDSQSVNRYNAICGLPHDALPLPFLFVATQPAQLLLLTHPDVSLKLVGMIQTHVSFHQELPLEIGKPYDFNLDVVACSQTDKGMAFELEGRFTVDGHYQASYRSRCLVRGPKRAPQPVSGTLTSDKSKLQEEAETKGMENEMPAWINLDTWQLTPKMAREYAAVSGDYNPIHLHWLAAKPFGFKAPLIHGMYSVARMFAAIDSPVSDVEFTFRRPAFLPSPVQLEAREGELRLLNKEGKPLVEAQYR